jgi:hypothetical protein
MHLTVFERVDIAISSYLPCTWSAGPLWWRVDDEVEDLNEVGGRGMLEKPLGW